MFNKNKSMIKLDILTCGFYNINVCYCNIFNKKLTIDLDNFKYNECIIPIIGQNIYINDVHFLDLDDNSLNKIKKLCIEIHKLEKELNKHNRNDNIYNEILTKKYEKEEEIKKVKLGKFYFELRRNDYEEKYNISYNTTNIKFKGYNKVTDNFKNIVDLHKKREDSHYEGYQDINDDELKILDDFYKNNKDFFILYKNTFIKKRFKGSNEDQVVEYEKIIDIFKKNNN